MEKVIVVPQFVKKFPAFYGTRSVITNFHNLRLVPVLSQMYAVYGNRFCCLNTFLIFFCKQTKRALSFSYQPTHACVLHGKLPP